jgi:hypothetical protein
MLRSLCEGAAASPVQGELVRQVFEVLTQSWAGRVLGTTPAWACDITDDGSPFELSVAFTSTSRNVRLLVESQGDAIGTNSTWHAGLALNDVLRRRRLADPARFERVRELFEPPPDGSARFSLWHAAVVPDVGAPLFKAYLNPNVHGPARAPELIREAFHRLGHAQGWAFLEAKLAESGSRALYFSLDLTVSQSARIKVYVARVDSADAVGRMLEGTSNVTPGVVPAWIEALAGRRERFDRRPILGCFAFTSPHEKPRATVHVPVRCYLDSDAAAQEVASAFLSTSDAALLDAVTSRLARGPLQHSRGLITYVSLRPTAMDVRDVTLYLAPRLYTPQRQGEPDSRIRLSEPDMAGTDDTNAGWDR